MRICDIAVVGLGLMGASAFYTLRRRQADVLGFDPRPIGSTEGSSHGSCRIFRRFNFESAAYTALSDQAIDGWRSLESFSGREILRPSQVLEAGPPGSSLVQASRIAAASIGNVQGPRSGAEANGAFGALRLPNDWEVVVQTEGGILMVPAALQAFCAGAGDRIFREAVRLERRPDGIHLHGNGEETLAQKVIVAAGPWLADLVPAVKPLLKVTRQSVGWFKPSSPSAVALGAFPIFLLDGPYGVIYGFPDFEGRGVKAGRHDHGAVVGADDWGPPPADQELEPVRKSLERFIPGAAGPMTDREICLYTNTLPGDVRIDLGEEFIIDRLPEDPRIIVASPCSGHGAKFATAIGAILADLALDPTFNADVSFRLDRFSGFQVLEAQTGGADRPK